MIDEIQSQFNYLMQMRRLLNDDMQINNFSRINNFSKSTGLTSFFVYKWVENSYRESIQSKSAPVNEFSQVNQELINHLDKRICKLALYLMLHNVSVDRSTFSKLKEVQDLWITSIRKDSPRGEDLLRSSLYVQDILNGCEMVINNVPEEAESFLEKELSPFIENSLSSHLELLPENHRSKIVGCFESLKDAMSSGKPEAQELALSKLKEQVNYVRSDMECKHMYNVSSTLKC